MLWCARLMGKKKRNRLELSIMNRDFSGCITIFKGLRDSELSKVVGIILLYIVYKTSYKHRQREQDSQNLKYIYLCIYIRLHNDKIFEC